MLLGGVIKNLRNAPRRSARLCEASDRVLGAWALKKSLVDTTLDGTPKSIPCPSGLAMEASSSFAKTEISARS